MTNINEILRKHKLWLEGKPEGEKANLSGANLSYANLRDADFSGADLSDADLSDANLRVYQADLWTCYIQADNIHIGCRYNAVDEGRAFSDEEISKMHSDALHWLNIHKEVIFAIRNTLTTEIKKNV